MRNPRPTKAASTHGLSKFGLLDWSDPKAIDKLTIEGLTTEEYNSLQGYLATLASDTSLNLTPFEIKRLAVAMVCLDRGDQWFFGRDMEHEVRIQLQTFLAGKEELVLKTLAKARENAKPKPTSLFDQLNSEFKNFELKAEGSVEGVNYVFETKKRGRPKMINVPTEEKDGVKNG